MKKPRTAVLILWLVIALLVAVVWIDWPTAEGLEEVPMDTAAQRWASIDLAEVEQDRQASGRAYREMLRVPALNAGLYRLSANAVDQQQPHDQDEIYYVVEGRARMTVDGQDTEVRPGQVIYVKAGVDHRFHTIVEELALLVVFSAAASG